MFKNKSLNTEMMTILNTEVRSEVNVYLKARKTAMFTRAR